MSCCSGNGDRWVVSNQPFQSFSHGVVRHLLQSRELDKTTPWSNRVQMFLWLFAYEGIWKVKGCPPGVSMIIPSVLEADCCKNGTEKSIRGASSWAELCHAAETRHKAESQVIILCGFISNIHFTLHIIIWSIDNLEEPWLVQQYKTQNVMPVEHFKSNHLKKSNVLSQCNVDNIIEYIKMYFSILYILNFLCCCFEL